MMKDIEIARSIVPGKIINIAKDNGIDEEYIECYGNYKAKVSSNIYNKIKDNKNGKLILVTAINPTPLGEGKTTVSIGLHDALKKIGKKSLAVLREPSMGPVFGMKGGATGGGHAQIIPMEDINLHFTGDIHAITSANNLLSAMIDNHIYQGNELGIKRVIWRRCLDVNDRALRGIEIGKSREKGMNPREDVFDITAASEIMAILCLAEDMDDLKRRLGNILIGYNESDEPVFAKQIKAEGAMTVLLKDAMKPNLVQTLEHNLVMIHGGPFANIAHGCNSIVATKMGLKLADYIITEAGFGADLGAEKFLDIKCRKAGLKPDAVCVVATIKALKYHGGQDIKTITDENLVALKNGMHNLIQHVENLRKYGVNVIVGINKYITDTDKEIELLQDTLKEKNIPMSLVEAWEKGGEGAIDLAEKIAQLVEKDYDFKFIYDLEDSIENKVEKVAKEIYGADGVEFSDAAKREIENIKRIGKGNYPVCIAKTQYSFSDDPKNLECKDPFKITVKEIILKNGAEFVVAITGKIFTMPGLPKKPAAEGIDLDENGDIVGIF
ncbi:MAG: formate--tetrahydrofolate ligase [Clostridia bacterium]|nr:formate--tetrahydrofolate ligase [Clostridia bacterium]